MPGHSDPNYMSKFPLLNEHGCNGKGPRDEYAYGVWAESCGLLGFHKPTFVQRQAAEQAKQTTSNKPYNQQVPTPQSGGRPPYQPAAGGQTNSPQP